MSSYFRVNYSISEVEIWVEHFNQWWIHLSLGVVEECGKIQLFKDLTELTFFKDSWIQGVNSQYSSVGEVMEESAFLLLRGKIIGERAKGKFKPPRSHDNDDG